MFADFFYCFIFSLIEDHFILFKEFGPLIVSIDTEGRNLFEENKVIFNQRKDKAVEEICKHVSFIK